LEAQVGEHLRGSCRLQLPQGHLGFDLASEVESIDFSGSELAGGIDREGVRARLDLPLTGLGAVRGEVTLTGFDPFAPDFTEQAVTGQLSLRLQDISRLSSILPRLQNARGEIVGDFTLAGSLSRPRLNGSAELREGGLDIPELGLELREIALQMSTPSLDQIALEGGLRSGQGRLRLKGRVDLDASAGFPTHLHLSGSELSVANLPEAEIQVSPDLTLERDLQGTRLKGRLEIPFARLRPRKLPPSAVTVSSDLVVVGGDEPQRRSFDPRIESELRVVLGDRVSFDGFGLRGRLTGTLLVIDEAKRPVIGRGRIGISEGTYRAYGQDLKIERGYVLYVDNPVDNPGLDVRAVREIEEVTAGVVVSGTLKSPTVGLFSSPAMDDSDVMSYLLTGRPAGTGGGEGIGIAAALKVTGAGNVADELARQFGLDELRIDAGSKLEEASVVAGTYLSPRLYIQYINELASRETKLRMRYDINKRLQLEAETGKTQAGDLYYTFDR
ncbi:MAG: translocation/assembly module TamB domain-containing protein, partial [Candidatus Thiodiazotropha sp.]